MQLIKDNELPKHSQILYVIYPSPVKPIANHEDTFINDRACGKIWEISKDDGVVFGYPHISTSIREHRKDGTYCFYILTFNWEILKWE